MSTTSLTTSRILCKRFHFDEIIKATNDFQPEMIIGSGAFGKIYKGKLEDGGMVAVKRLNKEMNLIDTFRKEIKELSKFHHQNVISLIGYCQESQEMILVYEYVKNGTLADHLFKKDARPLSWEQRLRICLGVAHGLAYLHGRTHTSTIVHGNLKPANILLDENLSGKISDFGTSRLGYLDLPNHRRYDQKLPAPMVDLLKLDLNYNLSRKNPNSRLSYRLCNILLDEDFCCKISDFGLTSKYGHKNIAPTPGYMAPEFISTMDEFGTRGYMNPDYIFPRKKTRASDVYAFGIILLEVLCGRRVYYYGGLDSEHNTEKRISDETFDQIVDKRIKGKISPQCLYDFTQLVLACLQQDPSQRPKMPWVEQRLGYILNMSKLPLPSTMDHREDTKPARSSSFTDYSSSPTSPLVASIY